MSVTQQAKAEVAALLKKGEKLSAVKHLHETYHFSLIQSKIIVDAMAGKYVQAPVTTLTGEEDTAAWDGSAKNHVHALLKKRRLIEAIGYTKKTLGISLKEAKELVEELDRFVTPDRATDGRMPFFARVILFAFGVPGVVMLAVAGYQVYSQDQTLKKSDLIEGRVVSLNARDGMTAPVIEYEWNGKQWMHASTTYSSPPAYAINEAVPIYIDRDDPQHIIVNTFMDRWFLITVLGSMGLFFTGIPLLAGALNKRR